MRILIGWDNLSEAETIELIANVEEHATQVMTDPAAFSAAIAKGGWDVVVISLKFPSRDECFTIFEGIRELYPNVPTLLAWERGEALELAKFISRGLHSHLFRDPEGEYLFLLTSMIEACYVSAQAQRSRLLAERLKEEVDSVRRLQESVIPRDLPEQNGYRIVARYEPAQIRVIGEQPVSMAGGDYYDVFSLDGNTLILLVGDASGHGVKACMSIMTMHTLIRMIRGQEYTHTSDFVGEVNRRLCANDIVQDEGGFITLLYVMLDTTTHTLRSTASGAPLPILQNLATNEVRVLGTDDDCGLPLAIDEDWEFSQYEFHIPDNHRLLIYTDGLSEAFPPDSDAEVQFGIEGIIATLQATAHLSLEEVLQKLFDDSLQATHGQGRADDTSVVLLERRS